MTRIKFSGSYKNYQRQHSKVANSTHCVDIKNGRPNDPGPVRKVDCNVRTSKDYSKDKTAVGGLPENEADVFQKLQNRRAGVLSRSLLHLYGYHNTTPWYVAIDQRPSMSRNDVRFDGRDIGITGSGGDGTMNLPLEVVQSGLPALHALQTALDFFDELNKRSIQRRFVVGTDGITSPSRHFRLGFVKV